MEHGSEPFSVRFMELLADPAHWAFEITGEALSSLVAYPFIRLAVRAWVKAHDRKEHDTTVRTTEAQEAHA